MGFTEGHRSPLDHWVIGIYARGCAHEASGLPSHLGVSCSVPEECGCCFWLAEHAHLGHSLNSISELAELRHVIRRPPSVAGRCRNCRARWRAMRRWRRARSSRRRSSRQRSCASSWRRGRGNATTWTSSWRTPSTGRACRTDRCARLIGLPSCLLKSSLIVASTLTAIQECHSMPQWHAG